MLIPVSDIIKQVLVFISLSVPGLMRFKRLMCNNEMRRLIVTFYDLLHKNLPISEKIRHITLYLNYARVFNFTFQRKIFTNLGYGFIEIKKENECPTFKKTSQPGKILISTASRQPRSLCGCGIMVLRDFLLSDGWRLFNNNLLLLLHYRMNRALMLPNYH